MALLAGTVAIKMKKPKAHERLMKLATLCAGLFLVAYVSRWSLYGSKKFAGTGGWRTVYLSILLPHILLAIGLGPMALRQLQLARSKQFDKHKSWGRITVPVWLFVAISGWAVYWLLYVAF